MESSSPAVVPISAESGSSVVLELIYRLKVKDVMTRAPSTTTADESMREAQERMRSRRITGLPVMQGASLAGIVSMEDIIEALNSGHIDEPVGSHMTRTPIVLEDDMPLSFAITYLNRYGYGRFPVLDRDHNLVGIVTATDIIRCLLVEMNREVEQLEARLRERQPAEEGMVQLSFRTVRYDFENAGRASKEIKNALKELAIDPATIRRAAVACYELELNQVIHSLGGTISCNAGNNCIEIIALDDGPGIPDVKMAMIEGFSTANEWIRSLGFGAGMGLPNAKRVSDEFSLDSSEGRGTTVRVAIRYSAKESEKK